MDTTQLLDRIREEVIDWRLVQRVEDPDSQRRRFADERLADLADRLIAEQVTS